MTERIQKLLSAQGICSRRAAEKMIAEGRVRINGQIAQIGQSADIETDTIVVDGKTISLAQQLVYIMLNKPRGYVTTMSDEAGRKNVSDLISDIPHRLWPVGRLDMHSEGLLIMTNDGELTNKLTHPSHKVYKKYLVRMTYDEGTPPESPDVMLSASLEVDGVKLLPAKCKLVGKSADGGYIMTMAIREGKNRQIRRMCVKCGFTVNALKRVAVGDVKLSDLPGGKWRHLTEDEVNYLKNL